MQLAALAKVGSLPSFAAFFTNVRCSAKPPLASPFADVGNADIAAVARQVVIEVERRLSRLSIVFGEWDLYEHASDGKRRKRFLDAACTKLGFCLQPMVQDTLTERTDLSAKEFVRAVIEAEGIEPLHLESYEHFRPLMSLYRKHVLNT